MNKRLIEEIIYHIFAELGILPSEFVNKQYVKSIIDKGFLLPERLTFEVDNQSIQKNIYGCQSSVLKKEIKMLLADCSTDKELPEYCLFVQLQDSPAYCMYFVYNGMTPDQVDTEALLAINTKNQGWIPCTMYLYATFLAAMEQFKDMNSKWIKCSNYQNEYQQLLKFIKFHASFFDEQGE